MASSIGKIEKWSDTSLITWFEGLCQLHGLQNNDDHPQMSNLEWLASKSPFFTYNPATLSLGGHNTTLIQDQDGVKKEEKSEKESNTMAFAAAVVIGFACIVFQAISPGKHSKVQKQLKMNEALQTTNLGTPIDQIRMGDLNKYTNINISEGINVITISNFAKHSSTLLASQINDYVRYRWSALGAIASSGIILLGSVALIPSVFTSLGMVGIVLSAAFATHTWATRYFGNNKAETKAKEHLFSNLTKIDWIIKMAKSP